MCPSTLRYQACLSGCSAQSCPDHDFDSDPDQCSGLTEGCVCPEGMLLHRPYSALCIPPEKCGKPFRTFGGTADERRCFGLLQFVPCRQPALTVPAFLVRTARCGRLPGTPAACTAVTRTPSSQWSTTAPVWPCQCAGEPARSSLAWPRTPAAARVNSAVRSRSR